MADQMDESVIKLWNNFLQKRSEYKNMPMPESLYFCDNEKDADECAELVAEGTKQATSTSLWWFETNHHPLPEPGNIYIVTNWYGQAKAIIQTTFVEKVPFKDVTKAYAEIEGEGDKSLDYWKKVHWEYYSREMKNKNETPNEDMIIVCEQFKTIWPEGHV